MPKRAALPKIDGCQFFILHIFINSLNFYLALLLMILKHYVIGRGDGQIAHPT